MGVFEGPVASTGVAVTVEASHPKRRGMNNGFFQCSISFFGLAVAPILATQLLEHTGWRNVFYIVGIPGLIIAAFLWMIVREPSAAPTANSHAAQAPRAPFWSMFKHRNIPLAVVSLLCAMCGIFVISAMMSNYLVAYLKLPNTEMGFVSSAIGFGGVLGQLGVLTVSDYIGRRLATIISFVVAAIALYFFIGTGADQPTMLFVTLFFGMLDPQTGDLRFTNAGHNPPYLLNGNAPTPVATCKGRPLGVRNNSAYETGRLTLAPGPPFRDRSIDSTPRRSVCMPEERRPPARAARESNPHHRARGAIQIRNL